jgi:HD domain
MPQSIAGLTIPTSAMSIAARELVSSAETELLFNHSNRVFAFGALSGVRHAIEVDSDLLYVSAMFHRVGLTEKHRGSQERFEIDSANAARHFLRSYGVSNDDIQEVWDAIALHTTPGIAKHKSPLVALLTRGVEADTIGLHLEDFSAEQKQQVLGAYRREEHFKEKIIEALGLGMQHRPETTFGTVNADILDRVDPKYRRRNFCGLVLGSVWAD